MVKQLEHKGNIPVFGEKEEKGKLWDSIVTCFWGCVWFLAILALLAQCSN